MSEVITKVNFREAKNVKPAERSEIYGMFTHRNFSNYVFAIYFVNLSRMTNIEIYRFFRVVKCVFFLKLIRLSLGIFFLGDRKDRFETS